MVIGHAFLKWKQLNNIGTRFFLNYCWPITLNLWNIFNQLVFSCIFTNITWTLNLSCCTRVDKVTNRKKTSDSRLKLLTLLTWPEKANYEALHCQIQYMLTYKYSKSCTQICQFLPIFMTNTKTLLLFSISNCKKIFLHLFELIVL